MKSSADINLSSRRELLLVAAGGLALAAAPARAVEKLQNIESRSNDIEAPMASAVSYIERHVLHDGHMIYTREYPGKDDPAFVLMHGFPDNLHIYDYVVPYLTKAGRRHRLLDRPRRRTLAT